MTPTRPRGYEVRSVYIALAIRRAIGRAKGLTESQRMIGVGGIVVVMALLAAWVIFFWPAY